MCGRMTQYTATLRYRDQSNIAISKMDGSSLKGIWCGHVRSENMKTKSEMEPVNIPGVTMVRHWVHGLGKGYARYYDKPATLRGHVREINTPKGPILGVFVETRDVEIRGHKERWPVYVDKEPKYEEKFEEGRD